MMHEPSTAPEPQGWDPEEEDHSPCPQDHGDEEYSAGLDAARSTISFPYVHAAQSRKDVATSGELS
jgi:hypothetical protein